MTTEPKSKFIAHRDGASIIQDNGGKTPPTHKNGTLAREGGDKYKVVLWEHRTGKEVTSYTGDVQPTTLEIAKKMQAAALDDVDLPPNLKLELGQIVLFKNDKGDNAKRPDFYGYSRTADGVNRHSVWEALADDGTIMLRGSTEAWTPKATVTADPDTGEGRPVAAAKGVKQAHTAKR